MGCVTKQFFKSSTSLAISEAQILTTLRFHLPALRMAGINTIHPHSFYSPLVGVQPLRKPVWRSELERIWEDWGGGRNAVIIF